MVACEYHRLDLVAKYLLAIFEPNPKEYSKAIGQMKKMLSEAGGPMSQLEITLRHRGFASIPISSESFMFVKDDSVQETQRLANVFVANEQGLVREVKIYFHEHLVSGIEVRDDLEKLQFSTLDFSNAIFETVTINKYLVRDVDLEAYFEDYPALLEFLDTEYLSEEYYIDNKKIYRIISFDDIRCIGVDENYLIYKVNLKNGTAQVLFKRIEDFIKKLEGDKDFVDRLFGALPYC